MIAVLDETEEAILNTASAGAAGGTLGAAWLKLNVAGWRYKRDV